MMTESRNSIPNSTSQARMSIDSKILPMQQPTVASIPLQTDPLPPIYAVPEPKKETSEAATDTPRWSPEPNLMVKLYSFLNRNPYLNNSST